VGRFFGVEKTLNILPTQEEGKKKLEEFFQKFL